MVGSRKQGAPKMGLSLALYNAANRMVRSYRPFLEPFGLTFPQYLVMVELLRQSPRHVGELGVRLSMDFGTVTPILQRLQAAGFVLRTRDPSDERRVQVTLTAAGAGMRERLLAIGPSVEAGLRKEHAATGLGEALTHLFS